MVCVSMGTYSIDFYGLPRRTERSLGQPGMLPRQGEADMKQNNPRERARSKEVSGYQIQPMLPMNVA